LAAESALSRLGSRLRDARFQWLADLRQRIACRADCLRYLWRPCRPRSQDPMGEGDGWQRFAHGTGERQHADGCATSPGGWAWGSRARGKGLSDASLQTHTYLRYSGVILASRITRP